jgi:hypothetical protein
LQGRPNRDLLCKFENFTITDVHVSSTATGFRMSTPPPPPAKKGPRGEIAELTSQLQSLCTMGKRSDKELRAQKKDVFKKVVNLLTVGAALWGAARQPFLPSTVVRPME